MITPHRFACFPHKKVKGRKRVLLTSTEGLLQALGVVLASVQDRDTPALIEPELAAGRLRKVWADLAFAGERAAAPLERHGIEIELVGRKNKWASRSSRDDGRSSRPSVVSNATGACWSTTRAVPRCPAP